MSIFLMIVVSILIFGLVILFHELGHFMVAKRCGIKVNEFAIGMGPTVFKINRGETIYALRILPIGGFVSMEGEDEESDDAHSFGKVAVWKRVLVTISGAIMNLVLGFLAVVVLLSFGGNIRTRTVAEFMPDASTQASGLQVGDTIVSVNGRYCFTVDDLSYEFARIPEESVDLEVIRDGEKVLLEGVVFSMEEVVDEDTGETVRIMQPDFYVEGVPRSFGSVMSTALNTSLSYGRLIYLSLFDLIAGRVALNQLSGPVGIVSGIGKALAIGWKPVVQMLALISINLGIVNMLPLPALDGGRTVLLVVEGIRRKPIPKKAEIAINVVGFSLLMLLMLVVSFNDIVRLF